MSDEEGARLVEGMPVDRMEEWAKAQLKIVHVPVRGDSHEEVARTLIEALHSAARMILRLGADLRAQGDLLSKAYMTARDERDAATAAIATAGWESSLSTIEECVRDAARARLKELRPPNVFRLVSVPHGKQIAAIKSIRMLTGLGLRLAYEIVQRAPDSTFQITEERYGEHGLKELRDMGCVVRGRYEEKVSNISVGRMVELYRSGLTLEQIGLHAGLSDRTVGRRLEGAGVHRRNHSERAASGPLSHLWKGGRGVTKDGYAQVWIGRGSRILEHRLIVSKRVGRALTRSEVVHHDNEIKNDNRDSNLVLTDRPGHRRLHKLPPGVWSRRHKACIRCKRTDRKHASHGLCTTCNQYRRIVNERGYEVQKDASGKVVFSGLHRARLSKAAIEREARRRSKRGVA